MLKKAPGCNVIQCLIQANLSYEAIDQSIMDEGPIDLESYFLNISLFKLCLQVHKSLGCVKCLQVQLECSCACSILS